MPCARPGRGVILLYTSTPRAVLFLLCWCCYWRFFAFFHRFGSRNTCKATVLRSIVGPKPCARPGGEWQGMFGGYLNVERNCRLENRKYDSDRSHKWKRRSTHLRTHNYGWSGTYFITICASVFDPLFEIPELRTILAENWQVLPVRFPSVALDEFVIMPDHIHFIIHIEGNVEKPTILHRVVGAYKSLTTVAWLHYLEVAGIAALEYPGIIWQEGYHDRIIRDIRELENTRQYIRNNPLRTPN